MRNFSNQQANDFLPFAVILYAQKILVLSSLWKIFFVKLTKVDFTEEWFLNL